MIGSSRTSILSANIPLVCLLSVLLLLTLRTVLDSLSEDVHQPLLNPETTRLSSASDPAIFRKEPKLEAVKTKSPRQRSPSELNGNQDIQKSSSISSHSSIEDEKPGSGVKTEKDRRKPVPTSPPTSPPTSLPTSPPNQQSKPKIHKVPESHPVLKKSAKSNDRASFGADGQPPRKPTGGCAEYFAASSWKPVFQSDTQGHLCLHNDALQASSCLFSNLVIDTSKIKWRGRAVGGEDPVQVKGQSEDDEYLVFNPGAFLMEDAPRNAADDRISGRFYMNDVFKAIQDVSARSSEKCDVHLDTVLMTMRYEYANLYHSTTDFFNTFFSLKLFELLDEVSDVTILFLDAHPQSHMDAFWTTVFSGSVEYIGAYRGSRVCIERAIFVPAGYLSATNLIPRHDCGYQPVVRQFGDFVINQFDVASITPTNPLYDGSGKPVVVFEFREDYFAHPRKQGHTARRLLNRGQIEDYFAEKADELGFTFVPISCSSMTLADQIKAFRSAKVLIAVHGAALSHVLYVDQSTEVIEVIPPGYDSRTHFLSFGKWAGVNVERVAARLVSGTPSSDEGFELDPTMFDSHLQKFFS
eukprot:ANDGO_05333.mRNA.1 Beta-(1